MKQVFASLAVAISLLAVAPSTSAQVDLLPPADTSSMVLIGKLGPSFYWIALEENSPGKKTEKVYDVDGKILAKISTGFMRHLKLEGTGRLENGKVLNFHQWHITSDGKKEVRYRFCGKSAPYGYGVDDYKLRAFKSVAVDPSVIPLGSIVYIPAARGSKLPDGKIHDGYFEAIDIGTAIINKRIDVFTSFGDQSAVFSRNGLEHGVATEVYLVKKSQDKEEGKDLN